MSVEPKKVKVTDGERSIYITDPKDVIDNITDSLPAYIWASAPTKECTYFNRAWLDYRGRALEQELIDGFTYGVHPQDVEATIEDYNRAFDARLLYESEYRIKNAAGEYQWVLDRGNPVYSKEDNSFLGYVGVSIDIDARKRLEYQLHRSQNLLKEQNDRLSLIIGLSTKLQSCDDVEIATTETLKHLEGFDGIIIACIRANVTSSVTGKGYSIQRQSGVSVSFCEKNSINTIAAALDVNKSIVVCDDLVNEPRISEGAKSQYRSVGVNKLLLLPLCYQDVCIGLMGLGFSDKWLPRENELNALEAIGRTFCLSLMHISSRCELQHRADHDSLTGLANRALLHKTFSLKRKEYDGCGMMLIDLDRFKEINDTLGHYMGDKVLCRIGPLLDDLFATKNAQLFRLGGDEFAVLIMGCWDEAVLVDFAHQIKERLCQPIEIDEVKIEIDLSIGLSFAPFHGTNSHDLLKCADVAMYEAKNSGKGVLAYNPKMNKYTPERFTIIGDLNECIRQKLLSVYFQPKYCFKRNCISGFEALVRWQHQSLGLLLPDAFVPLAEVSNIIHGLTENVLELSLKQQSVWRSKGYDFSVSINLSARNLLDGRLLSSLKKLIKEYGSDPALVELEITETALMTDPEMAVQVLNDIADLGVRLSIDDFGTGYSSLAYLKRLPVEALKIDRTFVSEMLTNEQDATIVRSTIGLAHSLDLKVVAEGVEEEQAMKQLKIMGCDMVQGYHIAKPMSWDDIERDILSIPQAACAANDV